MCKSLQPCLYGSPNKHESLRFERPKTTERVIKLTLLEGMMKIGDKKTKAHQERCDDGLEVDEVVWEVE